MRVVTCPSLSRPSSRAVRARPRGPPRPWALLLWLHRASLSPEFSALLSLEDTVELEDGRLPLGWTLKLSRWP